jgi:glycosyltransferase 2 family protein
VRSWVVIAATCVISLVCIVWVLHGMDLPRFWGEMRRMHWVWVTVAILSDVLVYLVQGWRWGLILKPLQRVSFWSLMRAIYTGLYVNEILPLRAGELIRCFMVSRSSQIPLSVTFASALIERIFDGVWLVASFFVALRIGKLPPVMIKGGFMLGIMVIVLAVLIGYAMYAREQSINSFFDLQAPAWFNTLIDDLHRIGHSRYLYYSFVVSGLYLLLQLIPVYATVRAFDLPVPWGASITLMVLLHLSAVVPQAPGNLGSAQWVTARTVMLWGVARPLASNFAMVLWGLMFFPLIVVGFFVVGFAGIKISHLHREATTAAGSSIAE